MNCGTHEREDLREVQVALLFLVFSFYIKRKTPGSRLSVPRRHATVHVAHVVHQAKEPGDDFGHSLHARHARERAVVRGLDKPQPHHRYLQE
jgi:hypothetical protein